MGIYDEMFAECGDVELHSFGLMVVNADRQIKRGLEDGTFTMKEAAVNGEKKTVITETATGRWFILQGGFGNDYADTVLLGAVCGDMAGSVYERNNIKYKLPPDKLMHKNSTFTDDTVMTCAVAEGIANGLSGLPQLWHYDTQYDEVLFESIKNSMQKFGRKYIDAGYGGSFIRWICSDDPQPYNSWGNGSAMRVSFAGWAADSLEEAEKLAEISASVTHNHPEGIKGAKAVAGCIFLLRKGLFKDVIFDYAQTYYDMEFLLDDIRDSYTFDVSCAGSVPQAIAAFLQGDSFADVIANAISIGGDSDTIAAIAGSLAEVVYPIPQALRGEIIDRLAEDLKDTIIRTVDSIFH